jgi:Xaa-Pro aminopeptidase
MTSVFDLDPIAEAEKAAGRAPKPPAEEQEGRLRRVRESLERHHLDGVVVFGSAGIHPEPIRYLSGYVNVFPGACSLLVLPLERDPILLIDQPWHLEEAARMSWVADVRSFPNAGRTWLAAELRRTLAQALADSGLAGGRVGGFASVMPVAYADALSLRLADGAPVWEDVVGTPSDWDSARIRETAAIADEGFAAAVEAAGEGVSEQEICFAALSRMASLGAEFLHGSGVSTHINIGSFSEAVSNVRPFLYSSLPLERGQMFWLDLSASHAGYFIDSDRTVSVGEPNDEQVRIYGIAKAMYDVLLAEARAGIRGGDLWQLATDVAVDAGYDAWSNHVYLGHTTGITTSTRPVVAPGETGELRAGSFLNVEPGIFVPGTGSACIENTLYVTESGASPINGFDIGIQIV